jgi:hypothetical protein
MGRLTVSEKVTKLQERGQILIGPRMVRIMNEAARDVRDFMVQRFMGGASTSGNRLARNTGDMERKTVARRATQTTSGTKATIAINTPYASVHFGEGGKTQTVIRPRIATALAVPLPAVLGPNRRPLLPARSKAITHKFTFGGILYGRLPGTKVQPLFSLRNSVTVPVRVHVERDIQPYATKVVQSLIEREAQKLLGA